jgi:hypothetical protein
VIAAVPGPQLIEPIRDVRGRGIHPADHAADQIGVRRGTQEVDGLGHRRNRLDDHGPRHTGHLRRSGEVGRFEVGVGRRHGVRVDPVLGVAAPDPQVVVGIDDLAVQRLSHCGHRPSQPPSTGSTIPLT